MSDNGIKLVKITNPMWMQILGPRISEYCERLKVPCVTYESMMSYLTNVVQFGGDTSEFWVAFENDNPVGFCLWCVLGFPYIGVVHCDQVYTWGENKEISRSLFGKFLEFAEKNRAPYIHGLMINKKVSDHFISIGEPNGISPIVTERIDLFGRRT
jgi:hypothetical protein